MYMCVCVSLHEWIYILADYVKAMDRYTNIFEIITEVLQ